jgi:hypothetical protein
MCIETLMTKVKSRTYTDQERSELLVKAKILDDQGYYHKDFFTKATVDESKRQRNKAVKK